MKLSELITAVANCGHDAELFVAFELRPPVYPVEDLRFELKVETGSLAEFKKAIENVKGPQRVVLVARVPEKRA